MKTGLETNKIARAHLSCWSVFLLALLAPALLAQTLNSAKDYCQRGRDSLERGQASQAIAHYDRAIELDSSLAAAFLGRGTARIEMEISMVR